MELSEYKEIFLSEAEEILNSSNTTLVKLEKEPANTGLLNDLFRQSHTLKSMAQSMGYKEIAELTHSMETTLALLRSGKLKVDKATAVLLFKSLDALGELVEAVKESKLNKVDVAPLVDGFKGVVSIAAKKEREPAPESKESLKRDESEHSAKRYKYGGVQAVRVPLVKLDNLMNIAGELSINKIRLIQTARTIEHNALKEAVEQISRLTSQLQDQMMQIRLVPLEYIFAPYPRMVRDMAMDQNKEVDLIVEGSDIGLDRSIQDEINEPLLHLLKNAVTHGIEKPEERESQKKPRRGRIKLIAKRERDFVLIELSDDGRGIDINEVIDTALKSGIITNEEISAFTPGEVMMLTTYPGYSRAEKVTEAAGRGVGLNASRIKIESLGGMLNIDTRPNDGAVFHIKLPLTMVIVQAMLVGVADETYCVPLSYIVETIKVSQQEIKTIERHKVISYRNTVLPLVKLRDELGFAKGKGQMTKNKEVVDNPSGPRERPSITPHIYIVVVESGSKKVGLIADSLLGKQEVVIKPLAGVLKEVKGVSGATILGTGKVAFIVDVPSLL